MHVVIVGAGLGGLSAACHLAGRGHDVEVIERADVPGGRAGLLDLDGYRFDTGPSVLTMTGILSDVFAAAGEDMAGHLTLLPVDPMYRACFPDGSELRVWHGRERMTAEIRDFAGAAEAEAFGRFCDWLGRLYQLELPNFIDRNFDSPLDLAWPLGPIVRLVRMGGFRKLSGVVESYFADPRLQQIFSFQAMYAGLSPFEALALYCVITYMDTVEGVYFPVGRDARHRPGAGGGRREGGGDLPLRHRRRGTGAARLPRRRQPGDRGAAGRRRGGARRRRRPQRRPAGGVPGTSPRRGPAPVDPQGHLLALVHGVAGGRARVSCPRARPTTTSTSAGSGRGRSRACSTRGVPMADPSILVTSPTVSDPALAPPGRTSLYVLEPMPNLDGKVDWATRAGPAAATGWRPRWRASATRSTTSRSSASSTPPTGSGWAWSGARPFALSHDFFQTGPFRPGNVTAKAPGVVFVGSGTVPGVGVPMVLLSGRLAADRVEQTPAVTSPLTRRLTRRGRTAVTLEESYERCRQLNRRYGTTYYWSTYLLPKAKRHHVHALYGFCRYADDIVDDLGLDRPASRSGNRRWPTSVTASSSTSSGAGPTTPS